jgi:chromosome segregation ATPase
MPMSTEHWNDERLDRLAATVESNARAIEALTSRQENADSRLDRSFELLETLTNRQENVDSRLDRSFELLETLTSRQENVDSRLDRSFELLETLASRQGNVDSRLDRSFELLETLTSRQENIDSSLDRCNNLIESNARIIQALANVAAESREEREELFQMIARQQNEIVGLRTETIRLLDLLLNQYRGDNPNT